ncbi:MAG: glycosyl transferase [Rhodobiaceae bacterium]|nr:glycosyl transferase [Rhodobiaceae bacterium]
MKALFITSNRIGDAILSTGLLGHLAEAYDNPEITVACGPVAAPLFAGAPGVVKVHTMRKEKWGKHWLRLLRGVFTTRWDIVVDLRGSATAYILWTRKRYVLRPDHTRPRVEHIGSVMGLTPPPSPCLWPSELERAAARKRLPTGEKVLAVGPTANWPKKMWPVEAYLDLALRLTGKGGALEGARILLTGGPGEQEQVQAFYDRVPKDQLIDEIGAKLLSTYAQFERVSLFIGNDSGLMHLAAAAGAPTLGLFGPTRDDLYAPWGENASFVRGPRSYAQIMADPDYDFHSPASEMADLTVEAVEQAAMALLNRTEKNQEKRREPDI